MLSYSELVQMERSLRRTQMLSLYIEGANGDPAKRATWRARVADALRPLEQTTETASQAEREALRTTVRALDDFLSREPPPVHAATFAVFISNRTLLHDTTLPISMPTAAYWGDGMRVSPYVRSLRPERPVFVYVGGVNTADVYEQQGDMLRRVRTIRVSMAKQPVYHMGDAPPAGFSPNTRGRTKKDALDRDVRTATHRVAHEIVEQIRQHSGDDAWLIVVGLPQVTHAVHDALSAPLAARTFVERAALADETEKTVARVTTAGVEELERRRQAELVHELINEAAIGGRGALGRDAIQQGLMERRVREVLFSSRFADEVPDALEAIVTSAFEQSALCALARGPAEEQLDRTGNGVGALLRYAVAVKAAGPTTASLGSNGGPGASSG
jgi:hypothetical protein